MLNGPAPQPLAAVVPEYDSANDGLHAFGTLGADLYNAFFAKCEMELEFDYGGS